MLIKMHDKGLKVPGRPGQATKWLGVGLWVLGYNYGHKGSDRKYPG